MTGNELARRVAFGDDGSAGADRAWRWLTQQHWPGWQVDVISVEPPDPSIAALFSYPPLTESVPDSPRTAPPSCELAAIRHLTTAYDPRLVLSELADVDLTVIGARGTGLLKAMRLGSTAEWLIRCPASPVVIARGDARVERVLACIDGSGHSRAAVEALAAMPWVADTSVTVLAVVEAAGDVRPEAISAQERLQSAGARVDVTVVEPDILALTVNPRLSIARALEDLKPDLVVLGTQGLTGLARVLTGSVASAVAHSAPCSVLLARDRSSDPTVEPDD
jgi:nucleotide-binding universal stress UspA family protein